MIQKIEDIELEEEKRFLEERALEQSQGSGPSQASETKESDPQDMLPEEMQGAAGF